MEVSGEDTCCLGVGCTGEAHQDLSCRFPGNGWDHLSRREGPSFSSWSFLEEEDQAKLHLTMGSRGEALWVVGFVFLGYILWKSLYSSGAEESSTR